MDRQRDRSEQTPLVRTVGLTKTYGQSIRALQDAYFELLPGETHALVGDNGAGKSTLVKMLSGAVEPTAGYIELYGTPVEFHRPDDAVKAGVATVHQNLALVGCRSVAENMFLGREPSRWGFVRRKEMSARALEAIKALRQMNLNDPSQLVANLSGGQRQAVAIARAVDMGSRILILDEPTAALGVRETAQVLDLVSSLRAEHRAVVMVSHNLSHVFKVADRVTVLRAGRIVGTVTTLDTTPDDVVRMITGVAA